VRRWPARVPATAGTAVSCLLSIGHSKSFHWIVIPSVAASQFGTLSVRTGPAPREISWNETVPLGGELEYVDRGTLAHAFGSRQALE